MSYIKWTKADRQVVAERAFEIRMSVTTETDIDCVRRAMSEMLATDKQRDLRGMSDLPWMQEQWRTLTKNAQSKTANGRVWSMPRVQAITPVVNPRIENESIPEPTIKDISTMDLWAELGRRISDMMEGQHIKKMIRDEVNATLERRLPGLLPPDEVQLPVEQPSQKERQYKLKVCVIGLLNGQQELIKKQYKDTVDFLFMEKTPSIHKIQQTAHHYDWVIQMIKYSTQVKGAGQIEKFHMCGGLLTQLRTFIDRQVNQTQVAA